MTNVALKVGRFESGKRAAASHTGALAGQETAFDLSGVSLPTSVI